MYHDLTHQHRSHQCDKIYKMTVFPLKIIQFLLKEKKCESNMTDVIVNRVYSNSIFHVLFLHDGHMWDPNNIGLFGARMSGGHPDER